MQFTSIAEAKKFCRLYENTYSVFDELIQDSFDGRLKKADALGEFTAKYEAAKNFIKEANNEISRRTGGRKFLQAI